MYSACSFPRSLRTIIVTRCLAILSLCLMLLSPAFSQENLKAIVNAVIIDGNGGPPVENGTIIIRNDVIEAVGTQLDIPAGAEIIDAAGRTALPGLADMHLHLSENGYGFDLLGYQRRLNALLYAGVTTVFETGGVLPFVQQLRQAIEADKIAGPHIYYVGPLIDSLDPQWPEISRSMASEAQALGIARYLKASGADAIKAYAKLSRPQVAALVVAGREVGLPVILDAWVRNGMEHYNTVGLRAYAHTPGSVTENTLSVMKARNVYIITTRAVGDIAKRVTLRGATFLQDDLISGTTPPWMMAKVADEIERLQSDDDYARQSFDVGIHQQMQENLRSLFEAGIPLVAGTDNDGLFIGDDLHFELELLVDAGLTPLEAITAATKNAALLMEDEDEWGTLEAGKRADILLVNGRPDKSISDTRKIELVIQKGRVLERERLAFDSQLDTGIRDTNSEY